MMIERWINTAGCLLLLLAAVALAGCGGGGGSKKGGDGTLPVSGVAISGKVMLAAPVARSGSARAPATRNAAGESVYLGYFNPSGAFSQEGITNGVAVVQEDGSFLFVDVAVPRDRNLIIRLGLDDEYMTVVSSVQSGVVTVAGAITDTSASRAYVIKAAAIAGKDLVISIADVLQKIPPSTLEKLTEAEISQIVDALISVIEYETELAAERGVTNYSSLRDAAFLMSQDIVANIDAGLILDEDTAWRIFELELRAWALRNGFTEADVDALLAANLSEFVRQVAELDIGTGGETGILAAAAILDQQLVHLSEALVDLKDSFGESAGSVDLEGVFDLIDVARFELSLNKSRFVSMEELDKFFGDVGALLGRRVTNRLGEMLLIMVPDRTGLDQLFLDEQGIGSVIDDAGVVIRGLLQTTYGDVGSIDGLDQEDYPVERVMRTLFVYLDDEEASVILATDLLDDIVEEFRQAILGTSLGEEYEWATETRMALGGLLASLDVLELFGGVPGALLSDVPVVDVNFNDVRIRVAGAGAPVGYGLELVDLRSGELLAYARAMPAGMSFEGFNFDWMSLDQASDFDDMIYRLGLEGEDARYMNLSQAQALDGINKVMVIEPVPRMPIPKNEFTDENYFFEYNGPDSGEHAEFAYGFEKITATMIERYYLNRALHKVKGIQRPPAAALYANGVVQNPIVFDRDPFLLDIYQVMKASQDTEFDYTDRTPDLIVSSKAGRVVWDGSRFSWMVTHPWEDFMDVYTHNHELRGTRFAPSMNPSDWMPGQSKEFWLADFGDAKVAGTDTPWQPDQPGVLMTLGYKTLQFDGELYFQSLTSGDLYYVFRVLEVTDGLAAARPVLGNHQTDVQPASFDAPYDPANVDTYDFFQFFTRGKIIERNCSNFVLENGVNITVPLYYSEYADDQYGITRPDLLVREGEFGQPISEDPLDCSRQWEHNMVGDDPWWTYFRSYYNPVFEWFVGQMEAEQELVIGDPFQLGGSPVRAVALRPGPGEEEIYIIVNRESGHEWPVIQAPDSNDEFVGAEGEIYAIPVP